MKKAGLLTIIMACFTFVFAMPAANATEYSAVDPNAKVNVTTNGTNNTLTQDINRGYNNLKYDVNRATNRVETDINRGVTNTETNLNRVTTPTDYGNRTYGVRDYDAYNTNTHRTKALNNGHYRTTATTKATRGFSWGWLGLLGLFGLAGMRSRDRDRA
ncbi:WGxxGxxG-CTERM domain-containing protein [Paenibacillus sp. GSMTC-2017]|uniref:WGxxGxxG-CTERM domain-containing protein n=1 Tax=Paenibacillus sp. GSMTC-2017 TaxID=2794350 RepID=UPI0018D9284B|nr:WGxxGxxG-CTERM domain-containing protein [Paenibacillus sp. GSMTC-2017]MBH5319282.1 WGxxGxxG-CTERM domain-containing protein [Paenibacillus sp. GSMTC-2017]